MTNRQLGDQHKIITAYNVLGTPCIELLITVNIYSEQRIHVIDQNCKSLVYKSTSYNEQFPLHVFDSDVEWILIFTGRKRSLGQGNVFTPVCHSVHRGGLHPGGLHPGGSASRGGRQTPSPNRILRDSQRAGGTNPTGMHSCHGMKILKTRLRRTIKIEYIYYLT